MASRSLAYRKLPQRGVPLFMGRASALAQPRAELRALWKSLSFAENLVGSALPVVLTGAPYANAVRGLQKLEADTAARTLRLLPMAGQVGAQNNNVYAPLWLERSAQIGDSVYYLTGGVLAGYGW